MAGNVDHLVLCLLATWSVFFGEMSIGILTYFNCYFVVLLFFIYPRYKFLKTWYLLEVWNVKLKYNIMFCLDTWKTRRAWVPWLPTLLHMWEHWAKQLSLSNGPNVVPTYSWSSGFQFPANPWNNSDKPIFQEARRHPPSWWHKVRLHSSWWSCLLLHATLCGPAGRVSSPGWVFVAHQLLISPALQSGITCPGIFCNSEGNISLTSQAKRRW